MAQQTNITDDNIVDAFGFHTPNETTGPMHREIRSAFIEFAKFLNANILDGSDKAIVFLKLESCGLWANKAIASLAPVSYDQKG